jgi:hypothetical protein
LDVAQHFTDQRAPQITTRVVRQRGCAAIRVTVKHVTSHVPYGLKSKPDAKPSHVLKSTMESRFNGDLNLLEPHKPGQIIRRVGKLLKAKLHDLFQVVANCI